MESDYLQKERIQCQINNKKSVLLRKIKKTSVEEGIFKYYLKFKK